VEGKKKEEGERSLASTNGHCDRWIHEPKERERERERESARERERERERELSPG
jgi:hypothetical protein